MVGVADVAVVALGTSTTPGESVAAFGASSLRLQGSAWRLWGSAGVGSAPGLGQRCRCATAVTAVRYQRSHHLLDDRCQLLAPRLCRGRELVGERLEDPAATAAGNLLDPPPRRRSRILVGRIAPGLGWHPGTRPLTPSTSLVSAAHCRLPCRSKLAAPTTGLRARSRGSPSGVRADLQRASQATRRDAIRGWRVTPARTFSLRGSMGWRHSTVYEPWRSSWRATISSPRRPSRPTSARPRSIRSWT
jgi:hypothetical protein